jgi:hypothetical protein
LESDAVCHPFNRCVALTNGSRILPLSTSTINARYARGGAEFGHANGEGGISTPDVEGVTLPGPFDTVQHKFADLRLQVSTLWGEPISRIHEVPKRYEGRDCTDDNKRKYE